VAKAGFKAADRFDLGAVVSHGPATSAGVFTTNLFPAAPVLTAKKRLASSDTARAFVANSGQANACTGEDGLADCDRSLEITAKALGVEPGDTLPASTGVIGVRLKLDRFEAAAPELAASKGQATPEDFARAIMTTDTFPKMASRAVDMGGEVRVMGFAKGAGMICPNMATMLGFVITDARVDHKTWRAIIREAADQSFNRITVDGDTSTNDCLMGLAGGASGAAPRGEGLKALQQAVTGVCQDLAYMIVQDAEGGTKVARIRVAGAKSGHEAELAARTVGNSPLVKTALFGCDPNWGRIAAALGRSGADFDPAETSIALAGVEIFKAGMPVTNDVDALMGGKMDARDISIDITLGRGPGEYELLASDLTHEYISINADYRT